MPATFSRKSNGRPNIIYANDINELQILAEKLSRGFDEIESAKDADYTATADDRVIPFALTAARTLTLPAGSGLNAGHSIYIPKTDATAFPLTIDGNGSEQVDFETAVKIYGRAGTEVVWDATAGMWRIRSGKEQIYPFIPRINVRWFGAKGDGVTDDRAAIQAAMDVAKSLGLSGLLGAIVYFPPGRYAIGAPLVVSRTGSTPTNVVWLQGADLRSCQIFGLAATFPTGRALIEWEDTVARAWHQRIADLSFNVPAVANTRAIHYKFSGTVTTQAHVEAQWCQIDMQNLLIEGNNDYHESFIKVEGAWRFSHVSEVYGDPSTGALGTYDTALFEIDYELGSSGNPPGISADTVGFTYGVMENCHGMVRRGGYTRNFVGRAFQCKLLQMFCNGGKSGNGGICYHFLNSYDWLCEGIHNEGQGEAAQIQVEDSRFGLFNRFGLGTPDATDAAWVANTAYTTGQRVVPTTLKQTTTAARNAYYECTTAGTSHATNEPTWPASGTVMDGTVEWTFVGAAVGNGLVLVGSTDCKFTQRQTAGGGASFSHRLVDAVTIDADSYRNHVRDLFVRETAVGAALNEMAVAALASQGNRIVGFGITGALGSEVYSPFAYNAEGPSFFQSFDGRVAGSSTAISANAVYLQRIPRVTEPKRVVAINVFVGNAAGNLDVGIYRDDPAGTATRVGSAGSTAAAGTNAIQRLVMSGNVWLHADADFWASVGGTDAALTMTAISGNGTRNGMGSLNVVKGSAWSSGLPASIATAAGTAVTFWLYVELE